MDLAQGPAINRRERAQNVPSRSAPPPRRCTYVSEDYQAVLDANGITSMVRSQSSQSDHDAAWAPYNHGLSERATERERLTSQASCGWRMQRNSGVAVCQSKTHRLFTTERRGLQAIRRARLSIRRRWSERYPAEDMRPVQPNTQIFRQEPTGISCSTSVEAKSSLGHIRRRQGSDPRHPGRRSVRGRMPRRQPLRMAAATALEASTLTQVAKPLMARMLHR